MSTGDRSYAGALAGSVSGAGRRFGVVASHFNAQVTEPLLESAVRCLHEHGADPGSVDVYRVPGAWEIPQACARLAREHRYHALVALGCLIRGETAHFDVIAAAVARALTDLALESGVPVVFGVLTTETEGQALERADPERGDKGREAALAALAMADLFARLDEH